MAAVRLAPSVNNSQPWFFTGEGNLFNAYCIKPGFVKIGNMEKLHRIDVGIAISHLWIAALHSGKKFEIVNKTAAGDNPPKGYYHVASFKIG